SLLRAVSRSAVLGQFRRMATGGARLSPYNFVYNAPRTRASSGVRLSFEVKPDSQPPTNIHVLIGRNGVGKTYLLNQMARAIVEAGPASDDRGRFESEEIREDGPFAGLVSVTFSAFDPFEPLPDRRDRAASPRCAYIGLRRAGASPESPK